MLPTWFRDVETSQTLLLNEQSRGLEQSGREVFKFGFGQSPFPPLASAVEALRLHAGRKEYTAVQGLQELRQRVAQFHRAVDGVDAHADRVLIAPGSKALLYAAMASIPRAHVLIPTPAWVSYAPQARLLGHDAIRLACDFEHRWRVTVPELERALRGVETSSDPRLMILNHPGNPDGLGYTEAELTALSEVCRRHDVLVISDEIYGLLDHAGKHVCMARVYPEGTIVTGGLSKWCGAGGWRLGTALLPADAPAALKHALLGIASETYSCASTPVQLAACQAYRWEAHTQQYVQHQRRLLSAIGNWAALSLVRAGVRVHAPTGGFYLFPDFSEFAEGLRRVGVTTSAQLCIALLRVTGVALLPGDAFGMPPEQLVARLAYVDFDGELALSVSQEIGLDRHFDDAAMSTVFNKTQRGVRQLIQWLGDLD